ncbi:MAG: GntR family transcriptional regulator [Bacteriovoracaceae bacterium]|nr:GntR family transcriptional regulator [Bacteriovoracaceae bacterium]
MIEIGKVNSFVVSQKTQSGLYLKESDSNSDAEVFMPSSLAPIRVDIEQNIEAFVYLDSKGDMIATEQIPYAAVGEYALMKVVDTQDFGAFFDWGIEKDLLVPGNEQKTKVIIHEFHLVRVCLEAGTNRVYGTTKLGAHIKESDFDIAEGQKVLIVPAQQTPLGYRVIIDKKFIGMIYSSEIFSNVQIGTSYQGVVKKIREDGLVDAALQVQGIQNLVEAKNKILEMLAANGGQSPLNDKSSPEAIKQTLGMSKKSFKSAVGMLYKERKIVISKTGIKIK